VAENFTHSTQAIGFQVRDAGKLADEASAAAQEASLTMDRLRESSGAIGNVVNLIAQIARQIARPKAMDQGNGSRLSWARRENASHPALSQNRGSVGSSLPPMRTGAIRNASPVASSVSTATPLRVAVPFAGSNRPDGMPETQRRSGSSFCMPMIVS